MNKKGSDPFSAIRAVDGTLASLFQNLTGGVFHNQDEYLIL